MRIVIRQSDGITYLPGFVGGGWSSDTQERLSMSINSSITVLRSNRLVILPEFGLALAFVNKCLRTRNPHHLNYLSSQPVIIYKESHAQLVQTRSESKLLCLIVMVSPSFAEFFNSLELDFPLSYSRTFG
jgi:hypothetical protein